MRCLPTERYWPDDGVKQMNYQLISEAIVKYVKGQFPASTDAAIEREFGLEIARDTRLVYDRAMNCPVDWHSPQMDMDTALGIFAEFMATEMPNISPEAKTSLNYCYIMCWK